MAPIPEKRRSLPLADPRPPAERMPALPPIAGTDEWARDDEPDLLRVGDLARHCGKTVRAIHLYEQLGLLRPHTRSKGRYRLFGADAVLRVRWIVKLQELGFSLSTIQSVVREWESALSAPGAMARMRDLYREKLTAARTQMERLRALEAELAESLTYLEACDTCDPTRIFEACTCCEVHQDQLPPDLVAGFRAT